MEHVYDEVQKVQINVDDIEISMKFYDVQNAMKGRGAVFTIDGQEALMIPFILPKGIIDVEKAKECLTNTVKDFADKFFKEMFEVELEDEDYGKFLEFIKNINDRKV